MMGKLDKKVAIVTGSGRGIGRAIAVKLGIEGAQVVINDLDDAPARETKPGRLRYPVISRCFHAPRAANNACTSRGARSEETASE